MTILLLRCHSVPNLRRLAVIHIQNSRLLITHRKYATSWVKADLPRAQCIKPKPKTTILKKFCILPGILLQGIGVVKCTSKDPLKAVITAEIRIEEPESSFDWNLLCSLLVSEIWRLLLAVAVSKLVWNSQVRWILFELNDVFRLLWLWHWLTFNYLFI